MRTTRKKKLLAAVLALVMVLGLLPMTAAAEPGESNETFQLFDENINGTIHGATLESAREVVNTSEYTKNDYKVVRSYEIRLSSVGENDSFSISLTPARSYPSDDFGSFPKITSVGYTFADMVKNVHTSQQGGTQSGDVSVIPGGDVSVIPGGDVTVIPGGDVTVIPGGDVTVIPGDDVTVIPGGDVSVIPGDGQQGDSQSGDGQNIPVVVIPGGDVTVIPGGDVSVIPGGDVQVIPGGDVTVIPGGDPIVIGSGPIYCISDELIGQICSDDVAHQGVFDVTLNQGRAQLVVFYYNYTVSFDDSGNGHATPTWIWEGDSSKTPYAIVINFVVEGVAGNDAALVSAIPSVGQFDREFDLYNGSKEAFIIVPKDSDGVDVVFTLNTAAVSLSVNGSTPIDVNSDKTVSVHLNSAALLEQNSKLVVDLDG